MNKDHQGMHVSEFWKLTMMSCDVAHFNKIMTNGIMMDAKYDAM
jgi:hypothetical protein